MHQAFVYEGWQCLMLLTERQGVCALGEKSQIVGRAGMLAELVTLSAVRCQPWSSVSFLAEKKAWVQKHACNHVYLTALKLRRSHRFSLWANFKENLLRP